MTPPNGQGAQFTVVKTKSVKLWLPITTETATVGRVQINNHAPPEYGNNYALYAGGNRSQGYGIVYSTQVSTPLLFSPGVWNLVQLVTPHVWRTCLGNAEQPDPYSGLQGLDTRYPFYPSFNPPNPSFPTGIPANNLLAQTSDSPGIPNLVDTTIRYRVSDDFSAYVMFLPHGDDVQWVPTWVVNWNWNADVSIYKGESWETWNDAVDAGIVRIGNSRSEINHPIWSMLAR